MTRVLFGSLQNIDDFTILAASTPYIDVKEIIAIVEDFSIEQGNFIKEFRWSPDGITFSQWLPLTLLEMQQAINLIKFPKFWIEFQYTMTSEGNLGVNSVSLTVTYNEEPQDAYPFPIAYARDKGNKYSPIRLRAFTWNPYKQDNSIKLQKDLSLLVNQIHGHEITYFRSVPIPESRDVIFLEWTLNSVDPIPKCIKVLIPDNAFPEHKLNHNAFGIDFELPFEVHIDKRYFEWIFGHNAKPQKRDIIYFPLTNRMYEVDSATISVQFMYDFLYWQINLVKWQPKRNILQSQEVVDMLDEYTTGISEIFGIERDNIYTDITNPQQLKDKSNKFDIVRNYLSTYDICVQESFINYYTTVFEYYYDMNKHYIASEKQYEKAVGYVIQGNFLETDNLALTCWFRKPTTNYVSKDIDTITVSGTSIDIKFKYGLPKVVVGNILKIVDSAVSDFELFGTITAINTNKINLVITMTIDISMLNTININYPTWTSATTLKGVEATRANYIYSFNDTTQKGIIIDIYNNKYLKIQLNASVIWFLLNVTLQDNVWYGLVINILNKFNQLSYHIYQPKQASDKTTKLNLIATQIVQGLPSIDRDSLVDYQILASPIHLSNIRILSESLEGDLHSKFLNMQLIKDASKALVIDNAVPRIRLPYIGESK